MNEALVRCEIEATRRSGLITNESANQQGVSEKAIRHQVRIGRWHKLFRGVYVLAGFPASWQQRLLALQLFLGPRAAASHLSAAALWGFPDASPGPLHFVSTTKATVPKDVRVHRVPELDPSDFVGMGQFRLTRIERTLIDVGAYWSDQRVEIAYEWARHGGKTTPERIQRRLESLGRIRGSGVIRKVLRELEHEPVAAQSALEVKVARFLRRSPLPKPVRQHPVSLDGEFLGRVDFAYPEARLVIEADGFGFHGKHRGDWEHTQYRRNRLIAAGAFVITATDRILRKHRAELLAMIQQRLGADRLF